MSLSEYGVLSVLDKEAIQPIDNIDIELFEGDNYIYLADMTGNYIYAEYLLKNEFTDMYITEAEMNTAIKQTEKTIELSVNQKLVGYSTTKEMEAKISESADNINLNVSKTYSTIENTNKAKQDAIDSANNSTDEKLKDYSTTEEMNAQIDIKADGITSSVSKTYATKDEVYSSVGTVNLVNNSDFSHKDESDNYDLQGWKLDANSDKNQVILENDKTWFRLYSGARSGKVKLSQIIKPVNWEDYYTLSFKLKNNDISMTEDFDRKTSLNIGLTRTYGDGTNVSDTQTISIQDILDEQTFKITFNPSTNEDLTSFELIFEINTLELVFDANITNIQLEKGTIDTEWRPSQTDFYYQVEQYSKVTQTVEEVKIEVGKKVDEEEFTGANFILGINNDISGATIEADKVSFKRKRN